MPDAYKAIQSVQESHSNLHYPHDEAGVGNLVVVGGVAVHQLHVKGELGQRDVGVNIVVFRAHPLHLDLIGNDDIKRGSIIKAFLCF